jgi:hypothetical protein
MKFYLVKIKPNIDPPEDWGRVLVPFASPGSLRLCEVYINECIIECGNVLIEEIRFNLSKYVDILPYSPQQIETLRVQKAMEEDDEAFSW